MLHRGSDSHTAFIPSHPQAWSVTGQRGAPLMLWECVLRWHPGFLLSLQKSGPQEGERSLPSTSSSLAFNVHLFSGPHHSPKKQDCISILQIREQGSQRLRGGRDIAQVTLNIGNWIQLRTVQSWFPLTRRNALLVSTGWWTPSTFGERKSAFTSTKHPLGITGCQVGT